MSWASFYGEMDKEAYLKVAREKTTVPKPKKGRLKRFLVKAGPGVGGALGLGAGTLLGLRRGKLLRHAIAGLGTGATLGWIPGMAHGVAQGVEEVSK
jgi:hypothetical protein